MTHQTTKGFYRAREAATKDDLQAVQRLRYRSFIGPGAGLDCDSFDATSRHLMIEDLRDGRLVACCRYTVFAPCLDLSASYSGQYYDVSRLGGGGAALEIGRFCIDPEAVAQDALRIAWGALTRLVETHGIALLFGCSSFAGTDPAPYAQAFAHLARSHLAPDAMAPLPKAAEVYPFAALSHGQMPDLRRALAEMPPLLRSYLTMGGWVSDHAVIDRDLNTLHVFTGVEVARIPAARARALRALIG